MKRKISLLCAALLLTTLLTGCGGSGVAPVVTVNGTELTIGESYIYTLTQTDEGYQERIYRADAVGAVPYGELEANSYCADLLHIYKDDKPCVTVKVYNPSREAKLISLCPISELTFSMEDTHALVNGIDFSAMDSAGVKEAMAAYKLGMETDSGTLRYDDGEYKYFFRFDEATGLVTEISVEIVFGKSY